MSPSESGVAPFRKLLWLDTILCDAEDDRQVIDRYFKRFLLTLETIGNQDIPPETDFRFVVNLSRDKYSYVPLMEAALDRWNSSLRASARIHLYDHPPDGYGVSSDSHIDRIKNPNKQPGRREDLFAAAVKGEDFRRYQAVIRISMDDDDLYAAGHLRQISFLADALLDSHPQQVSAVGLYRQNLATVAPTVISFRDVDFSRVIPGNKFYIIPASCYPEIARYSPWSIPELIDEDAVEQFAESSINLLLVRNNEPTFVYMRRAQNLSGQSKSAYIDSIRGEREFPDEESLVRHLTRSTGSRLVIPVTGPLPREFRLLCRRDLSGTVKVTTNFERMYGDGYAIAFYLMQGAERVDVRWYSQSATVSFPSAPAGCTVRAFVQQNGKIIARKAVRVVG